MTELDTIPLRRPDGSDASLADYAGQVILVVNVASKCGLTPQYQSLQRLYQARRSHGLVVLGCPCNQFRDQEPGSDQEIQAFCRASYGVDFPILSKLEVNGAGRHLLYKALIAASPGMQERAEGGMRARLAQHGVHVGPGDVMWNFEKFLISRDGRVVGRFAPDITVEEPPLREAIEQELDRESPVEPIDQGSRR